MTSWSGTAAETVRGDREMSTCEMLAVIRDARTDERSATRIARAAAGRPAVLLHLPALPSPPPDTVAPRRRPTAADSTGRRGPCPKTAEPPPPAQPPGTRWPSRGRAGHGRQAAHAGARADAHAGAERPAAPPRARRRSSPARQPVPAGSALRQEPGPVPLQARPPVGRPGQRPRPGRAQAAAGCPKPVSCAQLSNWAQVATAADRADRRRPPGRPVRGRGPQEVVHQLRLHLVRDRGRSCMALRFPRGGIGLVIGGGHAGVLDPLRRAHGGREPGRPRPRVARGWRCGRPTSFSPSSGLIGLLRVSRESGSTRGGDFQEVLDGIRAPVPPLRRRSRRAREQRMIGVRCSASARSTATCSRAGSGSSCSRRWLPAGLDPDQPHRHAQQAARPGADHARRSS